MRFPYLLGLVACTSARAVDYMPDYDALSSRQTTTDALEGYMFAYFTGDSRAGENIFFAASNGNNALNWTELNGGQPALTSTKGTTGLRDPFIIRSQDGTKFFLIATDLSIGSGTSWGDAVRVGSRYLEIWETDDLVTWSEQRHVLVSPPNAGNTWAPEAYYDEAIDAYVVFWASSLYEDSDPDHTGETYHRMMYATTQNFVDFTEAQVWQDAGDSRIDTTVLKSGDLYYRFTKDEGSATGCTDIIQEASPVLLDQLASGSWKMIATCIGRDVGAGAVEGPTAFKSNPGDANGEKFYLFVDEYGGRGYIPIETTDIANPDWKLSASYELPTSPRHGTVLPITAAELAAITSTPPTETGNSMIPGLYADPNIAVFGCNYYIYATTDGFPGWGGNQFFVWKSSNLVNWERSETAFLTLNGTDGNVPWAVGNAWAPTAIERDGKFYFYFSGHNPTYDRKTIGVASASSPEGPFTSEPEAMILNNEAVTSGQAIDPAAFLDPLTQKYYLYWGNGRPVMAELADDMISIVPDTIQAIQGLTDFREACFVVYREPYYHMTYSIDDTGSENYRVGYATAPTATGPWTYHGVVLSKDVEQGLLGTAHNSMINVPGTDRWYIAYHRFAIPGGNGTNRESTIDEVTFDSETGLMERVVPTLKGTDRIEFLPRGCEST